MNYDASQGLRGAPPTGEKPDLYDSDRIKTGKFLRRGDVVPTDSYYLCASGCIRSKEGLFMLIQHAEGKSYILLWEPDTALKLQRSEVRDAKWVTAYELMRMSHGKELNPLKGSCDKIVELIR